MNGTGSISTPFLPTPIVSIISSISIIGGSGRTVMQADKSHPAGFDRATGEIQTGVLRRSTRRFCGDPTLFGSLDGKFAGGKLPGFKAPLDRLLIFVRVGAVIPTQSVIQHTDDMPSAPVTLNAIAVIHPGKLGVSTLYQDAGDGYGYRSGDWRETSIENKQDSLKITHSGSFDGQKIRSDEVVGIQTP